MATAQAPGAHRPARTSTSWHVRLQAGARPLARELLVVRRRLQLHLDPDRRLRAVRVRLPVRRPGRVVVVDRRLHRADVRRAVLRRARRSVPARGLGLPVVEADRLRLRLVDDRLDPDHRLDRDRRRGRRSPGRSCCPRSRPGSSSSARLPTRATTAPLTAPRTPCCSGRSWSCSRRSSTCSASRSWRGSTTSA